MPDIDSIRRRTVLKASAIMAGVLAVGTAASASEEATDVATTRKYSAFIGDSEGWY